MHIARREGRKSLRSSKTSLLRWTVPLLAALLLVAGGIGVTSVSASAEPALPARTARQLLVDVQQARVAGLSGTVVEKADLGIPDLPGVGGADSSNLRSLISGTHTMRVWYASPDKTRVALLGDLGESDVVQNGDSVWTWSSKDNTAHHSVIGKSTPKHGNHQTSRPAELPKTPQQAADAALQAIDASTQVSVAANTTVAGRSAYELVLKPRDAGSLVAQVRIAVDGVTHAPLRVQVMSTHTSSPALEVSFTKVDFTRPADSRFEFTPPPGAKVTEAKPGTAGSHQKAPGDRAQKHQLPATRPTDRQATKIIGHGWSTVVVQQLPASMKSGTSAGPAEVQQVLNALPPVSGSWGSGRLLSGTLFSVLITDRGQLVAGAVAPSALYTALGSR